MSPMPASQLVLRSFLPNFFPSGVKLCDNLTFLLWQWMEHWMAGCKCVNMFYESWNDSRFLLSDPCKHGVRSLGRLVCPSVYLWLKTVNVELTLVVDCPTTYTYTYTLHQTSLVQYTFIHSKSKKVCGTAFSVKKNCGKSAEIQA